MDTSDYHLHPRSARYNNQIKPVEHRPWNKRFLSTVVPSFTSTTKELASSSYSVAYPKVSSPTQACPHVRVKRYSRVVLRSLRIRGTTNEALGVAAAELVQHYCDCGTLPIGQADMARYASNPHNSPPKFLPLM